jgi:hypothetical protein
VSKIVTLGLSTHDFEAKAWKVFPQEGITHTPDTRYPPSLRVYKELPGNFYETMTIPSLRNPAGPLKALMVEIRECSLGEPLAWIEINNKRFWFNLFLVDCMLLTQPNENIYNRDGLAS